MTDTPPDAARSSTGAMEALRKDIAASVVWSFQALFAAAAFSAISAASHSDWELLTGTTAAVNGDIEVPIVGLKVGLLAFFVVAPSVLIGMQIYLQVQLRALLRLPGGPETNGLTHNHVRLWPISLLGCASFILVPVTTGSFLWKIWPRRFIDDIALPFGTARVNGLTIVAFVFFAASCTVSLWSALSEWRCLRNLPDEEWRLGEGNRVAGIGLAALMACAIAGLVAALAERNLDMRKAPLERADLRYYDLRFADLREARLQGATMGGARLADAKLAGALLDDADLRGAELSRADLTNARLNEADLTGACLIGSKLLQVEIEGAHFTYAWMMGATLAPRPRTRRNRLVAATTAEQAYEKDGTIQAADFASAKLCAARIGVANWSPGAAIGVPDGAMGPALGDEPSPGDKRFVPPAFAAIPTPAHDDQGSPSGRQRLKKRLAQCMASQAAKEVARSCPEGSDLSAASLP